MDDKLDFVQTAAELVRAIRADRTQSALNRKLGYRTNQLYRWEAGLRTPSWADFVRLCKAAGHPIETQLKTTMAYNGPPACGTTFLVHLINGVSVAHVAERTGFSRFAISRWISGTSQPGLREILQVMHRLWGLLFVFLQNYVQAEAVPSLSPYFSLRQREIDLFYEHPTSAEILACLRLAPYQNLQRHSHRWVAAVVRSDPENVERLLGEMETLGLISFRNDKYVVLRGFVEFNGNFERVKYARKFWFNKVLTIYDQLERVPERSLAPAGVHACSDQALKAIVASYRTFLTDMSKILGSDEGPATQLLLHGSVMVDLIEGLPESLH